jgi:hypothetical protein
MQVFNTACSVAIVAVGLFMFAWLVIDTIQLHKDVWGKEDSHVD